MSLFEQMKLQAQKTLEEKNHTDALSLETLEQRNAKLKEVFDYWREFSDLIKVIQPDFVHPITLPGIGEMSGLKVVEPFSDYRHTLSNNQTFTNEIGNVSLFFFYKSPKFFQFQKELGIAARVKDVLWRYGIIHTAEDIKNEQKRIVEIAFVIPWSVKGSVNVTPVPNSRMLHFSIKNIAKLGEMEIEMAFEEIDSVFLDELSKLILGQENRFWKIAKFN
ncbi:MAG: hypothetical protein CTY33_03215 [Methylotenera sp.]|nr:MAG: hypothetical protein CTY33_03215 [Methylotenera sp.]